MAVGGGAATTTEYGDEATARATRGTMAHRALLASEAGAVGRWEYDGTAVVAEERSDVAQGKRGGRQWHRRSCGGSRRKRRRQQEMKCDRGEPRADAGEGEGALRLDVARPGRTTATRGLHRLHAAVEA